MAPVPPVDPIRDPEHAAERLRALIEIVQSTDGDSLSPDSHLTLRDRAWDRYLRVHLRPDASLLGMLHDTDREALIERVAISRRGWPARAQIIRAAVREAMPQRERKGTRAETEHPELSREARVWALCARTGPAGAERAAGTTGNVITILQHDSRWQGLIQYDEHAHRITVDRRLAEDDTVTGITFWIERTYGVVARESTVASALLYVARLPENRYHPVQDYLRSLRWDGVPRIHAWVRTYLGAEVMRPEHAAITLTMGRRWLVAAVARAMKPGCKVKAALLLLGKQYAGKTPALGILGGAWYDRTKIELRSIKEAMAQVDGVWICEIPEIGGMFKSRSPEDIKAFLDQETDRFRAVFGRTFERHPRGLVFSATDNDERVLRDPTGATRWWPVRVGIIDLVGLQRDRDQLWAEAYQAYLAGERWWLEGDEVQQHESLTRVHAAEEPWQDVLIAWIYDAGDPRHNVTVTECMARLGAAGRYAEGTSPAFVGQWLRALGWTEREGTRAERAVGRRRIFVRPKSAEPE